MKRTSRPENPLTDAAQAFKLELARYQRISLELKRTTVTSQKTLSRTQRLLGESVECEGTLEERLRGLLATMNGAREEQQRCMEMALAAAQDLQARAGRFTELLERVRELGARARDVAAPAAQIVSEKANGASPDQLLSMLNALGAQMAGIIDDANAIEKTAVDDEWPEIAKEVRSLRQQVQSAQAKVVSTSSEVGAHASS